MQISFVQKRMINEDLVVLLLKLFEQQDVTNKMLIKLFKLDIGCTYLLLMLKDENFRIIEIKRTF